MPLTRVFQSRTAYISFMMMTMMMMMCHVIQADNHQENLVIATVKKLDADGLVNFISINEVRYITEYNQVVGPPHCPLYLLYVFCLSSSLCFNSCHLPPKTVLKNTFVCEKAQ